MVCVLLMSALLSMAHEGPALRRPISPSQPAWIIHIDVWNTADPQKIIDLVPEDIRPYVIFNISTSSNDKQSPDGPAIYDSWMRVCAQNRVWTMIQCASGAYNRMPDDGSTEAYEQYFKDYPNFLGFNFAEQFWGFNDEGQVNFSTRLQLFADLMPICHQYGGYLAVSFTQAYYSASMMPIAFMKRNEQMRKFLTTDNAHFLCFEKYTMKNAFFDIESNCLGAWLGGYAGQYGIRFDACGWMNEAAGGVPFVKAAGAIPIAEHVMLTGQTIIDGPETIPVECSHEISETTVDGYKQRNYAWFPHFVNINIDEFRKILDGTIRIMSRREVIDRTKLCIVNDIAMTGSDDKSAFLTPRTLFDGLYRQDADQGGTSYDNHWLDNRWWLKSTGRYPAIPQVYDLLDADAKRLTAVKKSQYDSHWPTIADKQAELNQLFPAEYTGDIYAGRQENGWVTYNPYQYDETKVDNTRTFAAATKRATGTIPFQYNTCESISLDYAPYTLGIMREYTSQVTLYLTNYQVTTSGNNITENDPVEDVIVINGAASQPTITWKDRGSHKTSIVTTKWADGKFTITVRHNGPLDLTIGCSGSATSRKTQYTVATLQEPVAPPAYEGMLQYEAEHADYKSATCRKNGVNYGHAGYYGQGFVEMGSSSSALRDVVTVPRGGFYQLSLRYQADAAGNITVTANGKSYPLTLQQTSSWTAVSTLVELEPGSQTVIIQNSGGSQTFADCIQLESASSMVDYTPDENGEFHVDLNNVYTHGSVSLDNTTGIVTQTGGSQQEGAMWILFNHADFSNVTNIKVTYEGDGSVFKCLLITDGSGNSVNPAATGGAFWSSRYLLNYQDYRQVEASKDICKMEWIANSAKNSDRTMTIKDILIKSKVPSTGIQAIEEAAVETSRYYNLHGQSMKAPQNGIHIVRMADGTTKKIIY